MLIRVFDGETFHYGRGVQAVISRDKHGISHSMQSALGPQVPGQLLNCSAS